MENKENQTALQQAFNELEKMHPNLFNIYSEDGRNFINHFHKFLAIEKEQIMNAYEDGQSEYSIKDKKEYYNETYK
jgi:predicted RNA-binding protein with RPS1 domain